jgi:hypothetical protein
LTYENIPRAHAGFLSTTTYSVSSWSILEYLRVCRYTIEYNGAPNLTMQLQNYLAFLHYQLYDETWTWQDLVSLETGNNISDSLDLF